MSVKAIVLAGGESLRPRLLHTATRRPLLPFLNRPFIESQVRALRAAGIRHIGIAACPGGRADLVDFFADGAAWGIRLDIVDDPLPRGPGGCLKLLERFIGSDPFVVVNATTCLGTIDIPAVIETHTRNRALATIAVTHDQPRPSDFETVILNGDSVERFEVLHPSRDKRSHRRSAGVYVFSPGVLEHIPAEGHVDLKEQLIPLLRDRGRLVAHSVRGFHGDIDTAENYFRIQQEILSRGLFDGWAHTRASDDVWVGEDVEVADSAHLVGPVVLGRGCRVLGNACIVGPSVIGEGTVIEPRALVRESILWDVAHVGREARVEYSILGSGVSVAAAEPARETVMLGAAPPAALERHPPGRRFVEARPKSPMPQLTQTAAQLVKRAIDIVAATVALLACLPLFAAIALAIKLDSRGPVFFIQRRCGKDGREFRMCKFRTMVTDAERLQTVLAERKSVDGPMFKIFDDPRLTRVGAFLRRNSLDELPQLWNVLKGEMSLVGPRPLVMDEMRCSPGWRDIRLSVKPGITGIWQVNGRSQTSFHDWIRHDVAYVKGWSLWLDVKILAKTTVWVLRRTGAC